MNFTVCNHGRARDANGYVPYSDVHFDDIPDMVTSGMNYCACKLVDEYRLDDNFDGCVDVLIIDVDDTCTLDMAKLIFQKFEYYIVTSKSHQKLKNDVVCDRFRLFIPLDETVHIRQKMEMIYDNFIQTYDFIDTSCRNVSRFFYSSPKDAIVIKNSGSKYKTKLNPKDDDDTITKPTQEVKTTSVKASWLGEKVDDVFVGNDSSGNSSEENHLIGIQQFLDDEYVVGQRAVALFKASSIMKKDGFDQNFTVDYLLKEFNRRGGDKQNVAQQNIMNAWKY